jgi:multiple sugar transport system substrate-binding protein
MKKDLLTLLVILVTISMLAGCVVPQPTPAPPAAEEPAEEEPAEEEAAPAEEEAAPAEEEEVTITWATIAGFYTDWAEEVAKQFEEETAGRLSSLTAAISTPLTTTSPPATPTSEDVHPALVEASTKWKGNVWGLPYYTFTMGYFYRCDLFEDPDEMAAFEAEYGYPLDVPQP